MYAAELCIRQAAAESTVKQQQEVAPLSGCALQVGLQIECGSEHGRNSSQGLGQGGQHNGR